MLSSATAGATRSAVVHLTWKKLAQRPVHSNVTTSAKEAQSAFFREVKGL